MTGKSNTSSFARLAGRKNGTSAPQSLLICAISASSVETIVREIYFDFPASVIDHAMRGFPQKSLIFFCGRP